MLKKLSSFLEFGTASQKYASKGSGKSAQLKDSFDFLNLIKSWREIAGDKLSEHTIPLKNQYGTLIILSNHSAFAHQLSFMEQPLKKKIFEKFPYLEKSVTNIKFIVDSTHFEHQKAHLLHISPKEKKNNPNQLHPYSPEFRKLKKEALEMFSDITDEELKESFVSLYIQAGTPKNH